MTQRDDSESPRGQREPEVGTVAEEAAKLLGALHDWAGQPGADQVGERAQRFTAGLRTAADHVGDGQQCVWCPLCRAINLVRDTSPEVHEHLAAAIGSLAQAATAAIRHGASDPGRPGNDHAGPTKVDLDE